MARKNNSQQTISKILAVSTKLFFEKGYEESSVQDIVNELGMSKGAIFHHFKSKEEIYNCIIHQHTESLIRRATEWLAENEDKTAKEKITGLLHIHLRDSDLFIVNSIAAKQAKNPHVLFALINESIYHHAPIFAKLIHQGVEDGSIKTDHPSICAEMFMVLYNVWTNLTAWSNPNLITCDKQYLIDKIKFLQHTMKMLGVDVISDELAEERINTWLKQ